MVVSVCLFAVRNEPSAILTNVTLVEVRGVGSRDRVFYLIGLRIVLAAILVEVVIDRVRDCRLVRIFAVYGGVGN
jgi:hypothetical protein